MYNINVEMMKGFQSLSDQLANHSISRAKQRKIDALAHVIQLLETGRKWSMGLFGRRLEVKRELESLMRCRISARGRCTEESETGFYLSRSEIS